MIRLIIVVVVLIALALGGVLYLVHDPLVPPRPVRITVEPGASARGIAATLEHSGLLRSRMLFVAWAKLTGADRSLQPGLYEFSGPTAITDILQSLQTHDAVSVSVTIPEGWTTERMAPFLAARLGFAAATFLKLTRDTAVLHRWQVPGDRMEGYLLPETYHFYWGVKPGEVINRMAEANRALLVDSIAQRLRELRMSWHEVLTLASMVEAETANGEERRRIAAVFYNRLNRGMLLQCDPTVIYAMGGLPPGQPLLKKDLQFDSPYNTYLHRRLPPGPIGNPGRAAIMAVLYPDTSEELYFVADRHGRHVFSKTLREHNRARARIRRRHRR